MGSSKSAASGPSGSIIRFMVSPLAFRKSQCLVAVWPASSVHHKIGRWSDLRVPIDAVRPVPERVGESPVRGQAPGHFRR